MNRKHALRCSQHQIRRERRLGVAHSGAGTDGVGLPCRGKMDVIPGIVHGDGLLLLPGIGGCLLSRRVFLKRTGQGLATLPLIASASMDLDAEAGQHEDSPEKNRPSGGVRLNVRDFGAAGDGGTKDTLPLQLALDRCHVLGGGEVLVPAGKYLAGALVLHSNTILRLEAGAELLGSPDLNDYPIAEVRWEGRWIKGYTALISATEAENFGIVGSGKIAGSDAIQGRVDRRTGMRHPALLEFTSCRHVRVKDCSTSQGDMWSIHPVYCENITFRNLTVDSGADGIDVDSCRHVIIDGCTFSTADDCISLKSGRGEEGNTIGRPTEDVQISNCTFADRVFACIGIGTEMSGGIRDARVEHCKFLRAGTYAIYIKSRPGRGAFIENLAMSDLTVAGTRLGFLCLNLLNSGKKDEYPVPGLRGLPLVRNLSFSNIKVADVPVLVEAIEVDPRKPLRGFSLTNVEGTCGKGIYLAYMRDVLLKNIKVHGFAGPLIHIHDVSGAGLAEAVQMKEVPPAPAPLAAPAAPYKLH